jgi:hypothetical protein
MHANIISHHVLGVAVVFEFVRDDDAALGNGTPDC